MNECVFVVMVLVAGCVGAILPFVIFAVVLALKKETNVTEIKEGGISIFSYKTLHKMLIYIEIYKY